MAVMSSSDAYIYTYLRDHPVTSIVFLLVVSYILAALCLGVITYLINPPLLEDEPGERPGGGRPVNNSQRGAKKRSKLQR